MSKHVLVISCLLYTSQTYNSQILFKTGTLDMRMMATNTANVVPRANEINVRGIRCV